MASIHVRRDKSAALSPPCGERAGRGVPIGFMVPRHAKNERRLPMFLRETVSMKLSEGRRFIYATKACEANDRPYNARHRHRTGLELIMHQTEETLVLIK